MVAGRDAKFFGQGKNSWLTGTAAWTFTDISQYILGVYPKLKGLSVNPCVPEGFGDFSVTRKYRGVKYNISVKNPNGVQKGVVSLSVDGTPVEGHVIPLTATEGEVNVEVVMG